MDDAIPFASREYFILVAVLTFSRGMDILSTWVATPHLALEGNPIAKWLGWKWGAAVNAVIIPALALWPLTAIVLGTASVLIAARNFQAAWAMRSMGEAAYRDWYLQRLAETPLPLYLGCLAGNSLLPAAVGVALVLASHASDCATVIPYGIGLGAIAYGFAVAFFTLLGLWRGRRNARRRWPPPAAPPPAA